MAKKYLNYVGLETLAEIIKARFAPIELAIGRDSNDNLVAVTTRIKNEGADADYKEKYITLYTFEADDKTFIITTRDLRTGKTTDDIYDTTGELKLSAIYSPLEYTLRDVLKLVDPEETGMKVMYSVRDQLDEIIEDEGYSIIQGYIKSSLSLRRVASTKGAGTEAAHTFKGKILTERRPIPFLASMRQKIK